VLIGLVSLVLCAVRLRLNSLAASTLVHAAYNFTLFAGMLVATDGFRHLDKLAR
jgi:membrane protease YdiL (CAAX protease family)